MDIAHVVGIAVSTVKDPQLVRLTLLVCRPGAGTGTPSGDGDFVAVDTVGAGVGQVVLVARGSAARLSEGLGRAPTDATVVGIIDSLQIDDTAVMESGP